MIAITIVEKEDKTISLSVGGSNKDRDIETVSRVAILGTYSLMKVLLHEHMESGCNNRDCDFEIEMMSVLEKLKTLKTLKKVNPKTVDLRKTGGTEEKIKCKKDG